MAKDEISAVFEGLEQIQANLLFAIPDKLRPWSLSEHLQRTRGALVIGPRGSGKTTQLLKMAQDDAKFMYFSADNPIAATASLSALANHAFGKGYEGLIVDEVHGAKDWPVHLKAIYDSHPRKRILASDSSSLVLKAANADLSRRFPRIDVPFLSFREYLALSGHGTFEALDIFSRQSAGVKTLVESLNVLDLFNKHIHEGMRPFFLEGLYASRVLATLEKSILQDVPFFVPSVTEQHLRLMNAIVGHLTLSTIPTINVEGLCRDWSVGKEKLYGLLDVMAHCGVINIVRYEGDTRVLSKGAKMYLADPSAYAVFGGNEANSREAYVVAMATRSKQTIHAARDESKGDFVWEDRLVEVGGRSKKRKQADFVIRADVELPSPGVIPLWMLGFQG